MHIHTVYTPSLTRNNHTHTTASLRKLAKNAHSQYTNNPRNKWVLMHPAQLVLVVSQVHWCARLEETISSEDPVEGLKQFLKVCVVCLCACVCVKVRVCWP